MAGDAEIPAETICNSTGWGLTSGGGLFPPNALQWVQIPVHSHESCQEIFTGIEITQGMICAGGPGASACNVSKQTADPHTMCDFHNFDLIFAGQCTVCLKG